MSRGPFGGLATKLVMGVSLLAFAVSFGTAEAKEFFNKKYELAGRTYQITADQTGEKTTFRVEQTSQDKEKFKDIKMEAFLLANPKAKLKGDVKRSGEFSQGTSERGLVAQDKAFPWTVLNNSLGRAAEGKTVHQGTVPIGNSSSNPAEIPAKARQILGFLKKAPLGKTVKQQTGENVPSTYQTIAIGDSTTRRPTLDSQTMEQVQFEMEEGERDPRYAVINVQTEEAFGGRESIALEIPYDEVSDESGDGANPKRYDIVGIKRYGREDTFVKRIIGLPGEKVEIRKGIIYINGKPLEEPYVQHNAGWTLREQSIGKNEYFVVGDDRDTPMNQHALGIIKRSRITETIENQLNPGTNNSSNGNEEDSNETLKSRKVILELTKNYNPLKNSHQVFFVDFDTGKTKKGEVPPMNPNKKNDRKRQYEDRIALEKNALKLGYDGYNMSAMFMGVFMLPIRSTPMVLKGEGKGRKTIIKTDRGDIYQVQCLEKDGQVEINYHLIDKIPTERLVSR
jgi:signal peptidase I